MKEGFPQNNEDMFFALYNEKGEEIKCEILFTFEHTPTGKNYVVFTDYQKVGDGSTKVYANEFDPKDPTAPLRPIEEEYIWGMIQQMLLGLQEGVS